MGNGDRDIVSVVDTLHPLEVRELLAFGAGPAGALSDEDLAHAAGIGEAQHRRAVELLTSRALVEREREEVEERIRFEGEDVLRDGGMYEVRIVRELGTRGECRISDLRDHPGWDPQEVGKAVGFLKRVEAISIGEGGMIRLVPEKAQAIEGLEKIAERSLPDGVPLQGLSPEERPLAELKVKRRGKEKGTFSVSTATRRWYRMTDRGREALEEVRRRGLTGEEVTALTPAMLKEGSWKGKSFRRYNLDLAPPRVTAGRKHPYRSYLDFVKAKLLGLGFKEMSGSLVEPEFWNLDALFMPQFHASREIHDIYLVREPSHCASIPSPFLERVGKAHEDGGGTGSRGWGYPFDGTLARRLVLRSQGTVLSGRTLASGPDVPGKYFAMARCFRPDKVDATHAVDFFQVEGIVLGEEVTLRTLLGLLRTFALEIARAREVSFVPSYFPFTEPSVEARMKHPKLGWVELGGAGIFRREVTDPLGVTVPVAAWGLGLDRMAMVALGINDIRDLFSRDLNRIRETKVRF